MNATKSNVDVRQELWDQFLVEGWIADRKMWQVVMAYYYSRGDYELLHSHQDDVVKYMAAVRRGVRGAWECKMPVRAFFDLALPTTNKWLWAGARGERVTKILTSESRVAVKAVSSRYQKNQGRLGPNKQRQKLHDQQTSMAMLVDQHAGHRRSDWGKVKATNN